MTINDKQSEDARCGEEHQQRHDTPMSLDPFSTVVGIVRFQAASTSPIETSEEGSSRAVVSFSELFLSASACYPFGWLVGCFLLSETPSNRDRQRDRVLCPLTDSQVLQCWPGRLKPRSQEVCLGLPCEHGPAFAAFSRRLARLWMANRAART